MRVSVYDTTLRDGAQGEGVNFSLRDKLVIARRLAAAGVDFVEGGYPLSNPKDAEFFRAVRDLDLGSTEVAAFGMTRKKGCDAAADTGLQALLAAETRVVTIVGKSSTFHVSEVLGASLAENVAMIADSVRHCRRAGRRVVYDAEHFFDGYSLDADYALATLKAAASAGAEVVCLCDTNGGALPERVADVVARVRRGLDGVSLGIHCHNDGELAVANTLAAVRAGASQVQGTVNGVGERCGNADLVSVVANLSLKYGFDVLAPGSVAKLTDLSRFVYEVANLPPRHGQAFVGASAFAHKGGMHTHAVGKNPASYEHVDPALVGNDRRILVGELSGRATILAKTGGAQSLAPDALARVLAEVQEREFAGYEYEAAEASFDLLVRRATGRYSPWFERLASRVHLEYGPAGQVTEAAVKLRVNGVTEHTVAEGDGPVNALDAAARKALLPHFPRLSELELVDYKVRVVNARAGTAARVRVVVETRDHAGTWGTVGVSTDVVEASWQALADAAEHKLFREAESGANPTGGGVPS